MDKLNEKGITRNRYAKLQPLVNRINGLQSLIPALNSFNYHTASRCDKLGIDSNVPRLQNDFGNLVLATSQDTKIIKQQTDREIHKLKMPAAFFIDEPITSACLGTIRKHKNLHKHKNKEKLYRASLRDLKTELLNISNYILYIMWCPIVFFTRLLLSFVSFSASALYNVLGLSTYREVNAIREENALESLENKPDVSRSLLRNSHEMKQTSDLSKCHTDWRNDHNCNKSSAPLAVKNSVSIRHAHTDDRKSQKDSPSLRKRFNLSLKMVDEIRENSELKGVNHFQYSSRQQDISSVEMSSDCLSDKYSDRFFDDKECRRRIPWQYRDSVSIAGKRMSFFTLRNSSFKGSQMIANSRRQTDSRNSSRRSEIKSLRKNPDLHLSDASVFTEKKIHRADLKSLTYNTHQRILLNHRSVDCDSFIAEAEDKLNDHSQENSATLLINLRKKKMDKFRTHTFPRLPLRPTSQNKSCSEDEKICEVEIMKHDCDSLNGLKIDPAVPELQNNNLQPILEVNREITTEFGSGSAMSKETSQKKEQNNCAVVPMNLNRYNSLKVVPEREESTFSQYKVDLGIVKNEPTVSQRLKDDSKLDKAAEKDQEKKPVELNKFRNLGGAEKYLLESEETCGDFKEKTRTMGSEDRFRASKNETSRIAEFTKPIDAKSRWLEMKKKFYGQDYDIGKKEPKKLEGQHVSRMKSVSKLPAHKIFQYNMQVGRARQMGTELPSAEGIFLKGKSPFASLEAVMNTAPAINPTRNKPQSFQSAIPTSHCVSQTQSLSQWPLNQSGYSSTQKKYHSQEQKPKPKPKPRTGCRFNHKRVEEDSKIPTITHHGIVHFPQRTSAYPNSSMSSSDVRTMRRNCCINDSNRNGFKSAYSMNRTKDQQLVQLSDGETEDRKIDKTLIKEHEEVPGNLLGIDLQLSGKADDRNPRLFPQQFDPPPKDNPGFHIRPSSLNSPSQVKNAASILTMKNMNSSNEYADKIDSFISFR